MRSIRCEPGVQLGEWLGAQAVDPPLSVGADIHEAGVAQHAQVSGDAGLMHAGEANEFTDRAVLFSNVVKDATPRRFGDRIEHLKSSGHMGQYTP